MSALRVLATGCALAVLACAPLEAQQLPASVVNQRVRLQLHPLARHVEGHAPAQVIRGTVLALPRDSIRIRIHPGAAPFTIAASAIRHADVSEGVRTRWESWREGTINGAIIGGIEWAIFTAIAGDPFFGHSVFEAALTGAAVGAVIGGTIGGLRPQERWRRLR